MESELLATYTVIYSESFLPKIQLDVTITGAPLKKAFYLIEYSPVSLSIKVVGEPSLLFVGDKSVFPYGCGVSYNDLFTLESVHIRKLISTDLDLLKLKDLKVVFNFSRMAKKSLKRIIFNLRDYWKYEFQDANCYEVVQVYFHPNVNDAAAMALGTNINNISMGYREFDVPPDINDWKVGRIDEIMRSILNDIELREGPFILRAWRKAFMIALNRMGGREFVMDFPSISNYPVLAIMYKRELNPCYFQYKVPTKRITLVDGMVIRIYCRFLFLDKDPEGVELSFINGILHPAEICLTPYQFSDCPYPRNTGNVQDYELEPPDLKLLDPIEVT